MRSKAKPALRQAIARTDWANVVMSDTQAQFLKVYDALARQVQNSDKLRIEVERGERIGGHNMGYLEFRIVLYYHQGPRNKPLREVLVRTYGNGLQGYVRCIENERLYPLSAPRKA